jgi:O-antigen biosynthesis protein
MAPFSPAVEEAASSCWYDNLRPEVSIVIVNYNKSELTRYCLSAIARNTSGRSYEVIVVDNGSTAQDFANLTNIDGQFKIVRSPKNLYFGEGNNAGVQHSKGKYLVFLNNDAFVTENWLEPLVSVFELEPNVGGVGAKLVYPDDRLQEAGAFVDHRGIAIQRGKYGFPHGTTLEKTTIVDYCSAACFLTTRKIFDIVSGFDPTFEPAYYEDVDLCLKIASLELFIYFCPHSKIYHIENATTSDSKVKPQLANVVEINRQKFLSRWGEYLANRGKDSSCLLHKKPGCRSKNLGSALKAQTAVFQTPYDLLPGGGERYLLTAASALRETHRVFLVTRLPYSDYRLDYLERELEVELSGVSILGEDDLRNCGNIDLYVSMANAAWPIMPSQGRCNVFCCQFPFPVDDRFVAEHWPNLSNYNEIIVYSQFSHDCLRAKISSFQFNLPLTILHPPVPIRSLPSRANRRDRLVILSIGRFFAGGHNKRQDLLIEAVKRLGTEGVDCELHLAGTLHASHWGHYNSLLQAAAGLPVSFHPNASPTLLLELLAQSSIYWHAAGFEVDPTMTPEKCEHFGISILEAMAVGCIPFVVANGGPPEFVREGETGFQYSTLDQLLAKTKAIVQNPDRMSTIAEAARLEARRFGEDVFTDRWLRIVDRLYDQYAAGGWGRQRRWYFAAASSEN